MRGAPQVGFSATMRKINFRTSPDSLFLPTCFLTFEIRLQYSRNPARCHRTTVSGVTTRTDFFRQGEMQMRCGREGIWPGRGNRQSYASPVTNFVDLFTCCPGVIKSPKHVSSTLC